MLPFHPPEQLYNHLSFQKYEKKITFATIDKKKNKDS